MTPHSRICCVKLAEYLSIVVNEKTCLCPKERGDLLEKEWGDLLSQVVQEAQIRILFGQTERANSRGMSRWRLRNTNSKLIMTEEVHENVVKFLNLNEKNFTALKLKNFNDEINSFFMDSYCSKIWNYVKLIRKVSVKWKN